MEDARAAPHPSGGLLCSTEPSWERKPAFQPSPAATQPCDRPHRAADTTCLGVSRLRGEGGRLGSTRALNGYQPPKSNSPPPSGGLTSP